MNFDLTKIKAKKTKKKVVSTFIAELHVHVVLNGSENPNMCRASEKKLRFTSLVFSSLECRKDIRPYHFGTSKSGHI